MHYQPIDNTGDEAYRTQSSGPLQPDIMNNSSDDVWGGDDEYENTEGVDHPDMRRIENEHATAGYREGVNMGKQGTLQQGFDEGYTMGAAIGLQAGQILGVLEGIVEGLRGDASGSLAKAEEILADARKELDIAKLFSSEHWTSTGEPSYEVDSASRKTKGGGLAHPVIRKWTDVLEEQIKAWDIDSSILEDVTAGSREPAPEEPHDHGEAITKDPLDW